MHPMTRLLPLRTLIICCLAAATTIAGTGCASDSALAPAPNLYAASVDDPFAQVPAALRTTQVKVVYATDRQVEGMTDEALAKGPVTAEVQYTYQRSRTVSYGLCSIRMGDPGTTWEQLAQASWKPEASGAIPLSMESVGRRGGWAPFGPLVEVDGKWIADPAEATGRAEHTAALHTMLNEQLALTPRKELFVFVHGYNNTFAEGAFRAAQIWHYTGRAGVPVLFSWPAGSTGLLKGYTRDRESGEFANPHLKQFLRDLASCPEVEKIHLIAHSRGTDVLATALRELHLECRGGGRDTRTELKLGQFVMAAPDIDLDVFIERFGADRVGYIPEQLTVYCSPNDKAIGIADWLFGSVRRIGQLAFGDLTPSYTAIAKKHPVMSIIDVRVATDNLGHGYFLSSPAALSDLILVLRDGRRPGAANGRPLIDDPKGFWRLEDSYPTTPRPVDAGSGTSGGPG